MLPQLEKRTPISRRPTSPCSGQANPKRPRAFAAWGLVLNRMPRKKTKKHLETAEASRPGAVALASVARSVGAIAGAVAATAASVLGTSKTAEIPEQQKLPTPQKAERRRRPAAKQASVSRPKADSKVSRKGKRTRSRKRQRTNSKA